MDRPQAHPHPHRYPSHPKPIHYNRVPIGGPDRPPVTQSPSPGTIYASPSGGREAASSSYPIPSNGTPKRELGSPGVKRESGARDDSDQTADRSSIATRRSSTAYPDVGNDESKLDDAGGEPQRKKQKRNKPTLSCFECVERKTKVGLLSPGSFQSMSTACDERSAASSLLTCRGPSANVMTSRPVLCLWFGLAPLELLNLVRRTCVSWSERRQGIRGRMLSIPTRETWHVGSSRSCPRQSCPACSSARTPCPCESIHVADAFSV